MTNEQTTRSNRIEQLARHFWQRGEQRLRVCATGMAVASLFGENPKQQLDEDLRRFKQTMEQSTVMSTASGGETAKNNRSPLG